MYGTIARMIVKPGAMEHFRQQTGEMYRPAGFISSYVYQMDCSSDEVWLAVMFESEESYKKNAASPEQDREYRRIRELLVKDPEWHDGCVVFSSKEGVYHYWAQPFMIP